MADTAPPPQLAIVGGREHPPVRAQSPQCDDHARHLLSLHTVMLRAEGRLRNERVLDEPAGTVVSQLPADASGWRDSDSLIPPDSLTFRHRLRIPERRDHHECAHRLVHTHRRGRASTARASGRDGVVAGALGVKNTRWVSTETVSEREHRGHGGSDGRGCARGADCGDVVGSVGLGGAAARGLGGDRCVAGHLRVVGAGALCRLRYPAVVAAGDCGTGASAVQGRFREDSRPALLAALHRLRGQYGMAAVLVLGAAAPSVPVRVELDVHRRFLHSRQEQHRLQIGRRAQGAAAVVFAALLPQSAGRVPQHSGAPHPPAHRRVDAGDTERGRRCCQGAAGGAHSGARSEPDDLPDGVRGAVPARPRALLPRLSVHYAGLPLVPHRAAGHGAVAGDSGAPTYYARADRVCAPLQEAHAERRRGRAGVPAGFLDADGAGRGGRGAASGRAAAQVQRRPRDGRRAAGLFVCRSRRLDGVADLDHRAGSRAQRRAAQSARGAGAATAQRRAAHLRTAGADDLRARGDHGGAAIPPAAHAGAAGGYAQYPAHRHLHRAPGHAGHSQPVGRLHGGIPGAGQVRPRAHDARAPGGPQVPQALYDLWLRTARLRGSPLRH
eukprot:ctg_706.g381